MAAATANNAEPGPVNFTSQVNRCLKIIIFSIDSPIVHFLFYGPSNPQNRLFAIPYYIQVQSFARHFQTFVLFGELKKNRT